MASTPRPVATIVASTLAYLGLAVPGWGGFAGFFSQPPLVALVVVTCMLAIVASFSAGNLSTGAREDRSNRWILATFGLFGLLSAYLPAYTDRKDIWTLDGEAVRWLGGLLFAAGGVLRNWPVFVPDRRFSGLVAIQPAHDLVTTGIYGVVRHPSYFGLLTNALGWALAFRSGVGLLLAALMLLPLLVGSMRRRCCCARRRRTTPTAPARRGAPRLY